MEIWEPIITEYEDYTGLYEISNKGRIKALTYKGKKKEHILKPRKNLKGYEMVKLIKSGIGKEKLVHRLIAEAFIPNPENKPYIDHINTITNDNRIENLRWVTAKENINNPITRNKIGAKGKAVICVETQEIFKNAKQASEKMNLNRVSVSNCLKNSKSTCGGYHWEYIEKEDDSQKEYKNSKKVLCVEDNIIYSSVSEASKKTNINSTSISRCCNGKLKTAGKKTWKYI